MFICHEIASASLPEIGRRFGNRDHTTVLHASRKIRDRMASDVIYAWGINLLVFESIAEIELRGHAPTEAQWARPYFAWRSQIEGKPLARLMERRLAC